MPTRSGSPPWRIGSAPRAKGSLVSIEPAANVTVPALVEQLSANFVEQLHRSLGVALDGSTTSLAFVDHYLRMLAKERRPEVLGLVAAAAGAYYGELVRRRMGATWIGDGDDPRRLRLLLTPQFVHFSPIDQALEAIAGTAMGEDDERVTGSVPFDAAFGLRPVPEDSDGKTTRRGCSSASASSLPSPRRSSTA